jgi:PPP family 3-phenylpropionic acid transporter
MLLYAAMYAAFGVASPFLPALVNARGVPAAQLGLVLERRHGHTLAHGGPSPGASATCSRGSVSCWWSASGWPPW